MVKKWFVGRNLYSPYASIWNVDLEKLVVPSMFMNYDLLKAVVKSFDHATRVVRRLDGRVPVFISLVEVYATLYRVLMRVKKILSSIGWRRQRTNTPGWYTCFCSREVCTLVERWHGIEIMKGKHCQSSGGVQI